MVSDFERLTADASAAGRSAMLRVVLREYGGLLKAALNQVKRKEKAEMRIGSRFVRDFRLAARSVLRAPAFSALVVITLALGIGGATTIFSVVDAVLLEDLPLSDPDRLLLITNRMDASGTTLAPVSGPDFDDIVSEVPSLSAVAGAMSSATNLTGVGPAIMVNRAWVTANFFDVLGGFSPSLVEVSDQKSRARCQVASTMERHLLSNRC